MAASTWLTSLEPSAPAILIETILALGATPLYCPPDEAPFPAIRPATNVPWPNSSLYGSLPPEKSTPPMTRPARSATLATPVSTTATVTPSPSTPSAHSRSAPTAFG